MLQELKIYLEKCGIPCEIKDYSHKKRNKDELWEDIQRDYQQMEKWLEKKDRVMISILSTRIKTSAKKLLQLN